MIVSNTFSDTLAGLCYDSLTGKHLSPDVDAVRDCVVNGADVGHRNAGNRSILHDLVARGLVACVRECLETTLPIDWTVVDDDSHRSIFHELCMATLPRVSAAEMLRMFVERIETHPSDVVEWGKECDWNNDFLSLAAFHQRLSLFFPHVRDQPYYADQIHPIELRCGVWQWDWEALNEADRLSIRFPEDETRVFRASRLTGELAELCTRTSWQPDVDAVREYVQRGADVEFSDGSSEMEGPILHKFVREGNVACALVCLKHSTKPIDFRLLNYWDRTLLHEVCGSFMTSRAVRMLKAILDREDEQLEKNIDTEKRIYSIDWFAKTEYGETFFCNAAATQVLSVVWPMVKDRVLAFAEKHHPAFFPLQLMDSVSVFQWDWDALGQSDQRFFKLPRVWHIRPDDVATAGLSKMCHMKEPDIEEVQRCVEAGGNVNSSDSCCDPILNRFLYGPSVKAVEACLKTKRPIDFTDVGSDGWTPLHFLTHSPNSPEVSGRMLRLIVERVSEHPEDNIVWNHTDNRGQTFMESSDRLGKRSVFEEVLKDVPFFREKRDRSSSSD